ncbi:MAG: hypothetical protein NXI32_23725 [bacterium]|nr:hypothetical protein [bacterium]
MVDENQSEKSPRFSRAEWKSAATEADVHPFGNAGRGSLTERSATDRPSNASSAEPPVVTRPGSQGKFSEQPFSEFSQWLEDTLGSESYGAPRVFDLFTLLAVTLAFALMFALLRLIEPLLLSDLPLVAISLGTFVTLIAIAQLALWGGNKPRLASVVAGPAIWFVIAMGLTARNPQNYLSIFAMLGLLGSSILGVLAGYLGGAVVAGVFLVADTFRKRFVNPRRELPASNDDFIFQDKEP